LKPSLSIGLECETVCNYYPCKDGVNV